MTEHDASFSISLTPQASRDLEEIWLYTANLWSVGQANSYIDGLVAKLDILSGSPFMARERKEFSPPVRVHRHQLHLIIYRLVGKDLQVVRVAHAKQNWSSFLSD
jgi:toxin ParE1/3/4